MLQKAPLSIGDPEEPLNLKNLKCLPHGYIKIRPLLLMVVNPSYGMGAGFAPPCLIQIITLFIMKYGIYPWLRKKLIAWNGGYTEYILNNPKATFNFTKNSTHTIQTCVRIPFVFMTGPAKYKPNLGLITCLKNKRNSYTSLNSVGRIFCKVKGSFWVI